MKKFRFRLESVLSARKSMERLKQESLAAETRRELSEKERLAAAEQAHAEALRQNESGDLDMHELLLMARHRERLAGLVREGKDRVTRAAHRTEDARSALVDAARERSVVENLKERRRTEHRAEVEREEQKGLDEIAGRIVRGEGGNVAVTVVVVIILYLVLFVGLLKVTGVLDNQVIPRLKGQAPAAAGADSLAFLDGDIDTATRLAEVERLAAQRDSLASLSRRLDMKAQELDRRIGNLEKMLADAEKEESAGRKDYTNLAAVYAGMKPNQLKPIVAELDEETLYGVMSQLKGRQLGALLGVMEPARAALLSERLATGANK